MFVKSLDRVNVLVTSRGYSDELMSTFLLSCDRDYSHIILDLNLRNLSSSDDKGSQESLEVSSTSFQNDRSISALIY